LVQTLTCPQPELDELEDDDDEDVDVWPDKELNMAVSALDSDCIRDNADSIAAYLLVSVVFSSAILVVQSEISLLRFVSWVASLAMTAVSVPVLALLA
jgi:hypothetical protein